jgi:hypothetical protein
MKNTNNNIKKQIEVLDIELTGIVAITRKPNLLYREMYENRISVLIAKKNELIKLIGA